MTFEIGHTTSLLMISHIEGKSYYLTWTENIFSRYSHLCLLLQYLVFQIKYQKRIGHIKTSWSQLPPADSITCCKASLTIYCHWKICEMPCLQL